ncbi:MAG: hypothetical protein QM679_02780 [Patulibacter sp.]
MSRYDRRPLREWEQPPHRPSAARQIGMLRLVGFIAILAGSYVVLNRPRTPQPTTPVPSQPRIAVDTALAATVRRQLPHATLTTGSSAQLDRKLRSGLVVDLAVLASRRVAALAATERCSGPQAIAARDDAQYAACFVNAAGSSRALGRLALEALTDLAGRDQLLAAGFDVPDLRPKPAPTTP